MTMRCVDRRGRFDDHRGASDRAKRAPRGPMAYSQADKNAVGNALRRVQIFRRAPENACPKQKLRGGPPPKEPVSGFSPIAPPFYKAGPLFFGGGFLARGGGTA